MSAPETVIVGGLGKTGRRVLERLQRRGVPARVVSRSTEPRFDWDDRTTWEPALRGATRAYVAYSPDLAVPGAAPATGELARLAAQLGLQRLVLLSGRGEEEAQEAEREIQQSGVPEWTIVRCSWFMQNFDEGYMLDAVRAGELALPVDDMPEPFVDAEDIADVAAAALSEDGHAGEVYELTGPRLLSFQQAIEEIAQATGRPVRFASISHEQFDATMAEYGLSDDIVWLLRYLFTEVLDGRNAHLTDGVRRALGREPRDFSEYARQAAATGGWDR